MFQRRLKNVLVNTNDGLRKAIMVSRRRYRKKMNLFKIFRFPDFIQCLPDFSQRFPDFSLTTFFKVRKSERCGSLNPRLVSQVIWLSTIFI